MLQNFSAFTRESCTQHPPTRQPYVLSIWFLQPPVLVKSALPLHYQLVWWFSLRGTDETKNPKGSMVEFVPLSSNQPSSEAAFCNLIFRVE